ncbi:hypothetical protein SEMRO_483_G152000.1 [Seminavis robusta]|uniref:Uncharacterized protein n=1 Tax=Seminavis robusta TaxID=568900 RepID=A0A9N8E3B5_9STRA|nr:hypothetical protein SEMRO_483_G152000.1 [Seminavis robusta]|eukprot:Sro483_g152000.1 n/a (386) ;mRNA; f:12612-13769
MAEENTPERGGTPPVAPTRLFRSPVAKLSSKMAKDLEENEGDSLDNLVEYVNSALAKTVCFDLVNKPGRATSCTCLHDLQEQIDDDDIHSCAKALFLFCKLDYAERKRMVKEWIRSGLAAQLMFQGLHRESSTRVFLLPGSTTRLICRNALCQLIGYGQKAWKGVVKLVKSGDDPVHGLKNKPGNKLNSRSLDHMNEFFSSMKEHALPRATKIVRTEMVDGLNTAIELREEEKDVVELPSSMTKRCLYNRFIGELGWKIKWDNKGRLLKKVEIPDKEQKVTASQLPSWSSFRRFWKKEYPKLVIQKPSADICDQCYVFANKHKYCERHAPAAAEKKKNNNKDNEEDSDDSDAEELEFEKALTMVDPYADIQERFDAINAMEDSVM